MRVIIFISLLFTGHVWAQTAHVQASLKQNFPHLTVDQVAPSPIAGLYQVTAGGGIFYLTQEGRYVFSGDIIDLQKQRHNLTEDARKQVRRKLLNEVEEKEMITFSPAKALHVVTVFTYVDCGYCRKLQADMKNINALGVAIRYIAFPRSGPNTPTFEKMQSIWCDQNRKEAFTLAKQNKQVAQKSCVDDSVMRGFTLGSRLGISGTPTLIFEDGTMLPGYLSPQRLLAVAKQVKHPNIT